MHSNPPTPATKPVPTAKTRFAQAVQTAPSRRDALLLAAAAGARSLPAQPAPPKAKIRSSVVLDTLQGSVEERLEIAARAGIQSVEVLELHAGWNEAEADRFARLARSYRLGVDAIGGNPGWRQLPVSMGDPAHRDGFLASAERCIGLARRLESPNVLFATAVPGGSSVETHWRTLAENGALAADMAAKPGLTVAIMPAPGSPVASCSDCFRLLEEVDHPQLRLAFGTFPEQAESGNLIRSIKSTAGRTALYHIADSPDQGEPGSGEIFFPNVYRAMAESGFGGHIAFRYRIEGNAVESLGKSVDAMRAALG